MLLFLINSSICYAQQKENRDNRIRLGFNYGQGTQEIFPFNSNDYAYEPQFYKIQFNYTFSKKNNWVFEWNIEPSYYLVYHQLLNEFYVKPSDREDYLEKREEFTKIKRINEYVLNMGFVARFIIFKELSTYVLGSVGPMYSDTETERMNAGFAFSDIFGLGISYNIRRVFIDLRISIRHVSNLNITEPNNGYNSSNLEIGLTYQL